MPTYPNFDLLIKGSGEEYQAEVLRSPAGGAVETTFRPPFSQEEIEGFLLGFRRGQTTRNRVEEFGRKLFTSVFAEKVAEVFHESLSITEATGERLRIRLQIEAPDLIDLPWEYLYDPTHKRFLCLSEETTFMRYVPMAERKPVEIQLPLRVLVMTSGAPDLINEMEQEWGNIKNALSDLRMSELVIIERLENASMSALQSRLRQENYHIFHFIGQAEFDNQSNEGMLLLEDEKKNGHMVSGRQLGMLLHSHRTLRLTILDQYRDSDSLLINSVMGVARSMVEIRVPSVITMQATLASPEAYSKFTKEFYSALLEGHPLDGALFRARKEIFTMVNEVDWGKPILYTSSPDGFIFDIQKSKRQPASDTVKNKKSQYVDRARELFERGSMSDPTDASIWRDWALLEQRQGNIDRARELFELGSKANPSDVSIWRDWALLERRQGNIDRARELFEQGSKAAVWVDDRIFEQSSMAEKEESTATQNAKKTGKEETSSSKGNGEDSPSISDHPEPPNTTTTPADKAVTRPENMRYLPELPYLAKALSERNLAISAVASDSVDGWSELSEKDELSWGVGPKLLTGDMVLIYVPKGLLKNLLSSAQEKPGLRYLFTVAGDPSPYIPTVSNYAVPLHNKIVLENPITIEMLKEHEKLKDWKLANMGFGNARNAKAPLDKSIALPLWELILEHNPDLINALIKVFDEEDEEIAETELSPKHRPEAPTSESRTTSAEVVHTMPASDVNSPPFEPNRIPSSPIVIATQSTSIDFSQSEDSILVQVDPDKVRLNYDGDIYTSLNRINEQALLEAPSSREYGRLLFDGVIHRQDDQGGEKYSTMRGYDRAKERAGGKLRFQLFLDSSLSSYKWEYLEDSREDGPPLTVHETSPFYRRVGNASKRAVPARPLKILVAICNPVTLGRDHDDRGREINPLIRSLIKIDVALERDIIELALSRLGKAGLAEWRIMDGENGKPVSLDALREELQEGYHILHVLSHGLNHNAYHLVMEQEDRSHSFVSAKGFKESLMGSDLRLVTLAACQSAVSETGEALQGLGPEIAGANIPAVIAMLDEVHIDTAQLFTQRFYDDLARSGRVDMAMAAARSALYHRSRGEKWQWGIPVLFMNTDDGRLFDVNEAKAAKLPALTPVIKPYDDLAGQGDPHARKMIRAIETQAMRYGAGMEMLGNLRAVISPADSPSDDAPLARPQDREALKSELRMQVDINSDDLQKHVEENGSKLALASSVYAQTASALNAGKHVILIGPPGTGKTSLAHDICEFAREKKFSAGATLTTATADWTAFDTVGGYVPTARQTLQFRPGIFLQAIRAGNWLVIDEINRAEIDKSFGELFTVLSGQQADLPYAVGRFPVRVLPADSEDWRPGNGNGLGVYDYVIHPNWRIVATMNVYDKSYLFAMSFAFMRRFAFIDMEFNKEDFNKLIVRWGEDRNLPSDKPDIKDMLDRLADFLTGDNAFMSHRALGPDMVKDMIWYISDRLERNEESKPLELLCEAFLLYATPQCDGLDRQAICSIYSYLNGFFGEGQATENLLARIRSLYPHIPLAEWKAVTDKSEPDRRPADE